MAPQPIAPENPQACGCCRCTEFAVGGRDGGRDLHRKSDKAKALLEILMQLTQISDLQQTVRASDMSSSSVDRISNAKLELDISGGPNRKHEERLHEPVLVLILFSQASCLLSFFN